MDGSSVGICIFVIIVILAIIGVFLPSEKDKHEPTDLPDTRDDTDEETSDEESEDASVSPSNIVIKSKVEKPQSPSQITIYAFKPINTKRVCPYCDGENREDKKTCAICKRDIANRKG